MTRETCRFAPSTTGPAHLGTLAAALLAWLDARSRGARFVMRLEDLDPDRCQPAYARALVEDLTWLGIDWDELVEQSSLSAQHEAALDRLEKDGRLYPCSMSREELRKIGRTAPDGAAAYDNRGRGTKLAPGGWRAEKAPIRLRLPDGVVTPFDEGGMPLAMDPSIAFGDPVVRRRDGAIAYQLAVVVDDGAAGVTRVVRGRDIAPSTALQGAIYGLLALPPPVYRHHAMLLDPSGRKLGKSFGAARANSGIWHVEEIVGWLAWVYGLRDRREPCVAADLVAGFEWSRVRAEDRTVQPSERP